MFDSQCLVPKSPSDSLSLMLEPIRPCRIVGNKENRGGRWLQFSYRVRPQLVLAQRRMPILMVHFHELLHTTLQLISNTPTCTEVRRHGLPSERHTRGAPLARNTFQLPAKPCFGQRLPQVTDRSDFFIDILLFSSKMSTEQMKRPKLAKLELRILEALWAKGSASMRDIQQAFPEPRPAYTTITNTVYRMEAKKAVRRVRKVGNADIFEPLIAKDAARESLLDEILSFFGGRPQPMMAHLIESGKLTLDDIRELEKAAEEGAKRRKAESTRKSK